MIIIIIINSISIIHFFPFPCPPTHAANKPSSGHRTANNSRTLSELLVIAVLAAAVLQLAASSSSALSGVAASIVPIGR